MEMTAPSYYEDFCCLADRCRDNCCRTGWEIVIDEKTMDGYRRLPQPQRERILAGIRKDAEGAYCIQPRDGQCPFLDERGLCSLVLELGEAQLGDICALHPRYREWFPGRMEIGVGLCCEEAARLILSDPAPAEFVTYLTDADPDDEDEEDLPLYPVLSELRDRLFALLQDRARPLGRRMADTLRLAKAVQDRINREQVPPTDLLPDQLMPEPADWQSMLAALLETHREMECLEPGWAERLKDLSEHLEGLDWLGFRQALDGRGYEYEHLMVYLVFRYSLKAVYDGDFLGKVQQAVVMTLMMAALGAREWQRRGRFPLSAQIELTHQYSKEVEYSDDNMEALREALLFEPQLSLTKLLGLLEL